MFKRLKEEMLAIPILMVIVEFLRQLFLSYFPESGTFLPETELLIFVVKLWQFLWITCGVWILLRITFPKIYKYLQEDLYDDFENYHEGEKLATARFFFLGFLLCFILLFNGAKGSNVIGGSLWQKTPESEFRNAFCDSLAKQLYVRELTGNNDGPEVAKRMKSVGSREGLSWCGGHVGYNYNNFNIPNPSSAWSPAYVQFKPHTIEGKLLLKNAQPGDAFTLYYNHLKRVGHVGFIVGITHGYFKTNEGNTAGRGVREGDGVYSLLRSRQLVYAVSNYISKVYENHSNHHSSQLHCLIWMPKQKAVNKGDIQRCYLQNRKGLSFLPGDRYFQGFYPPNTWGQFDLGNTRYHKEFRGLQCREFKGFAIGKNGKWQNQNKMPVQGFGVEGKEPGKDYSVLQMEGKVLSVEKGASKGQGNNQGSHQMENQTYCKNSAGFCHYRVDCTDGCDSIYCLEIQKINHCWGQKARLTPDSVGPNLLFYA